MKLPRSIFLGGRVLFVLGSLIVGLHAANIETPAAGSPLRKAVMDGLRATEMFTTLSHDFHSPIVFINVKLRVSGDWAWVEASPTWTEGKNHGEPVSCLMRKAHDKWVLSESTGEDVATADDPELAFNKWRVGIIKKHGLPGDLIPTRAHIPSN